MLATKTLLRLTWRAAGVAAAPPTGGWASRRRHARSCTRSGSACGCRAGAARSPGRARARASGARTSRPWRAPTARGTTRRARSRRGSAPSARARPRSPTAAAPHTISNTVSHTEMGEEKLICNPPLVVRPAAIGECRRKLAQRKRQISAPFSQTLYSLKTANLVNLTGNNCTRGTHQQWRNITTIHHANIARQAFSYLNRSLGNRKFAKKLRESWTVRARCGACYTYACRVLDIGAEVEHALRVEAQLRQLVRRPDLQRLGARAQLRQLAREVRHLAANASSGDDGAHATRNTVHVSFEIRTARLRVLLGPGTRFP